jgi:hypothetical protein
MIGGLLALPLVAVLERGLKQGLWSVAQFNGGEKLVDFTLPSSAFLRDNPSFLDPGFRDLEAYRTVGPGRPRP